MEAEFRALLPRLRRYARAATGGREAGDAALAEALPRVAAALARLDDLRPPMHRAFAALIAALDARRIVALPLGGTVAHTVAALPPEQRHALLLVMLEGMPADEACAVLGTTPDSLARDLDAARTTLRPLRPARVMIIEDEPLVATHIAAVVEELGHDVCAMAADESEAWLAARRVHPQLILADLDLGAGGSGLAVALRIAANDDDVSVVYVTGDPSPLPDHALVVRKPYRETALRVAIGRALAARHATGR